MSFYFVSPSCPLAAPVMRPDSLPRLWRYINLLLTYLLTYLYAVVSLWTAVRLILVTFFKYISDVVRTKAKYTLKWRWQLRWGNWRSHILKDRFCTVVATTDMYYVDMW